MFRLGCSVNFESTSTFHPEHDEILIATPAREDDSEGREDRAKKQLRGVISKQFKMRKGGGGKEEVEQRKKDEEKAASFAKVGIPSNP